MGPLVSLVHTIDGVNERIGRFVSWFAVVMVLSQFLVVVLRYVFGIGSIVMQESVIYLHSLVFMLGAGYTLLHNGHVRVDLFYREASARKKALVDLFGVVFLLLPVCLLIASSSWNYVVQSWAIREGSVETSGIQYLYVLKSFIIAFCFLVGLQGIGLALRSFLIVKGVIIPEEDKEFHEVA